MISFKVAAVLGLVFGSTAMAQIETSKCGDLNREVEASDLPCLAREAMEISFPEVFHASDTPPAIQIRKFLSDEQFVRIRNSDDGSLFALDVNPKLYHSFLPVRPRPTLRAVRGIIAREMIETSDMGTASFFEKVKMVKNKYSNRAEYERNIDERAFEMGYASDIALYRVWLYGQLDQDALKKAQKRFYTPEEINEWVLRVELSRPVH